MSSVDNRVVNMKFENSQFESGVRKTRSSLDKLKEALQFRNGTKGFKDIQNAADSTNMSKLQASVDAIKERFSTMGIVAMTVLANIANKAVDAGMQLAKSLTIQPIIDGFNEYELQLNSIQTILANTQSKGTTLPQVKEALADLNTYADKTIYNFAEMTRNIGTFTAAGVGLETSQKSIKGIANLAAASGSNAVQASSAMYQLSQAIATGTLKLQDWNSVVNAGMGGQLFQDALKDTARAHGVAVDDIIAKNGSFRDSLQQGWITADILTETLSNMTIATNEMTEAEIAETRAKLKSNGYTDEQIDRIFELGNTATDAATKVKTFSQLMDTTKEAIGSGWAQTWQLILGDFEEAKELWTSVSDVLNDAINEMSDSRNKVLSDWVDLGGRKALIEGLGTAFSSLGKILGTVKEAFSEVFKPLTGNALLKATKQFKNFTNVLSNAVNKNLDKFKSIFKGIFSVFDIFGQIVGGVIGVIFDFVGSLSGAGGGVLSIAAAFGDFISNLDEAIKKTGIISGVFKGLGSVLSFVGEMISKVVSGIGDFVAKLPKAINLTDSFAGSGNGLAEKLSNVFSSIGGIVKNVFSAIGDAIFSLSSKLLDGKSINWDTVFAGLTTGAGASVLVAIKKFIDKLTDITDNAGGIVSGISSIFEGVTGSLEAMQSKLKAEALKEIAIAVGILAASLLILSTINPGEMATGLVGVTVLLGELAAMMLVLNKVSMAKGLVASAKTAGAMIALSTALLILSAALKNISSLNPKELVTGLVGVTAALGLLVVASKTLEKNAGGMIRSALSMILLAKALQMMGEAVSTFASINTGEMIQGLIGVGVQLSLLTAFAKANSDTGGILKVAAASLILGAALNVLAKAVSAFGSLPIGDMIQGLVGVGLVLTELAAYQAVASKVSVVSSVGLLILAAALNVLASALIQIGSLSLGELAKGLIGMAVALAEVSVASNLLPKDLAIRAIGFIVMAQGISILAGALTTIGGLSLPALAIALVGLAGSLTILTVAMYAMNGAIGGAAAMTIMSAALAILAPQLVILSSIPILGMVTALIAMAGAFTILAVAGYALAPIAPALLLIGGAIALIGAGAAAAGLGVLAVAAAFTMLLGVLAGGVGTILNSVKQIVASLGGILAGVISAIAANIPGAVAVAAQFIAGMLAEFVKGIPKFVKAGIQLILGFLEGVAQNIAEVVSTAAQVVIEFLGEMARQIPQIATQAISLIVNFVNTISANLGRIIDSAFKLIISFVNGLANAIRNNHAALTAAGKNLVMAIVDAVKSTVSSAAGSIFNAAMSIGRNVVDGAVNAIRNGVGRVVSAVRNLASSVINTAKDFLGIASPSKKFYEIGMFLDQGLANGISKYGYVATKESELVSKSVLTAAENTLNGLNEDIFNDMDISPEITPVVDLTDVEKKSGEAFAMLSRSVPIKGSVRTASLIDGKFAELNKLKDVSHQKQPIEQKIEFTQNNYSPRALSAVDIYRQTNSQLSSYGRMVVDQNA